MNKKSFEKLLNKNFQKFSFVFGLLAIGLVFNQCVLKEYEVEKKMAEEKILHVDEGDGPAIDPPADLSQSGGTEVAITPASVGIKSFEEIHYTFAALTGIDPENDSRVRSAYQEQLGQLPTSNDIKSFMTSHQVAILKLAGEYCHRFFDRNEYSNLLYSDFDLSRSPNEVLDSQGRELLVSRMINRFWGEQSQPQDVISEGYMSSYQLIDDLLMEENPNDRAATRKVAKGVCVTLLSSAPVTFL